MERFVNNVQELKGGELMANMKCDECGKPAMVKEEGLFLCGLCSAIINRNTASLLNNECTNEI